MNEQEYKKWEDDAAKVLSGKYSPAQIYKILAWFSTIKGSEERDLIGNDQVEAMLTFVTAKDNFDVYNSLMARLFIYAPLILKDAEDDDENTSLDFRRAREAKKAFENYDFGAAGMEIVSFNTNENLYIYDLMLDAFDGERVATKFLIEFHRNSYVIREITAACSL